LLREDLILLLNEVDASASRILDSVQARDSGGAFFSRHCPAAPSITGAIDRSMK
jgi:hypothetical protein